jgi:hypothetical protein
MWYMWLAMYSWYVWLVICILGVGMVGPRNLGR